MKPTIAFLAAILLMFGVTDLRAQVGPDYVLEMDEINVTEYSDHIFSNFIVEYPKEADATWKRIYQNDILARIENFFAEENPEMVFRLSDSDSIEAALKDLSGRLIRKTETLTSADTTLWEHDYKGERYYFNFGLQVEAIPLEGTDIASFHLMASEYKPWGERERNFEAWCSYDMQTGSKVGLRDIMQLEGFPALREAIEQFVTFFQLGDNAGKLLIRDCEREIPLPSEYDIALVSGTLRYSYPKDALVRGSATSGMIPIEMIKDYLTPKAKKALGL